MVIFKKTLKKATLVYNDPKVILFKLLTFFSPLLNDEQYLKVIFYLSMGYKLDLNDPQTFNEKLNWLKIHYRIPIMNKLVDKYEVKNYVSEKIGTEHLITSYGVWSTFDEIDFDVLPDKFVLKTTHDGGGVVICKDKKEFIYKSAKRKLERHLKSNHYKYYREWPYKDVKPRILAEEYIKEDDNDVPKDYKFFCFHGKVKALYIASGRTTSKMTWDFFDRDFNHLNIKKNKYGSSEYLPDKPANFDGMVNLAEILSKDFPHVRIDFYNVSGKILFGEFTFFQDAGLVPFIPHEWDIKFGEWLDLPIVKI